LFPVLWMILILVAVNATLTLHRWLAGEPWWFATVPALETLVVFWAMIALARLRGIARPVVLVVTGVVYGSLVVYSGAEALFQFIFDRPFVPRADIPMVRGGLLLVFGQIGSRVDLLVPVAIALILLVAWGGAVVLLALGSAAIRRVSLPVFTASAISVIAVSLFVAVTPVTLLSATVVSGLGSGETVAFQDVLHRIDDPKFEPGESDDPSVEQSGYAFGGILDRDIYVFAIEAYGYAAFSRDELYRQLEPDFAQLEAVLDNAGYSLVSHYLLSPVAGGFSWLAEATFLSGQWINSQPVFEQLYETPVSTLPGFLHDGGYFTFTVKPGTVHGSWPEGWELFRFEDAMIAYDGDFDYRGPWFSFVPITDQFAIHAAHQRLTQLRAEGGPARKRPVFAYYQLVSSHTPFNRIPFYVENWDDLGDGSIYHEFSDRILTFDNTWSGGTELEEGFVSSISYVFTVLSQYIERFMDHTKNPIIIIFGDHQPQRPIREQNAHLSVPVHIASRDPAVLEAFRRHGYTDGIRAEQTPPHPRMSEFFPLFVEVAQRSAEIRVDATEAIEYSFPETDR
jgi:hypothetical protein